MYFKHKQDMDKACEIGKIEIDDKDVKLEVAKRTRPRIPGTSSYRGGSRYYSGNS